MEWVGWISLIVLLCYSAYPGKVMKLESKVKRLERSQKGDMQMSKIISELIGKSCKIKTDEAFALVGSEEIECDVLDVDDEWIKFRYIDRKKNQITKVARIDSIESIELRAE